MAGGFTPVRGSLPPAAPTVWFCPIADRNTMLFTGGNQFTTRTSNAPALYANQCGLGNASFDGFITAPDGTTNTMQLIKEDNTTNTHGIFSGHMQLTYGINFYPRMRLSGFFKAGPGRTRVTSQIQFFSSAGGNQTTTINTVYDLAGGQVGVAPTIVNNGQGAFVGSWNQLTTYGAQVINFGGNVFRCDMDYSLFCGQYTGMSVSWFVDAGTGAGAMNISYAGNGTSGVYGWRVSLMPTAVYAMNTVAMFDDFTSLSSIDVNGTLAPGFKWYSKQSWNPFAPTSGTFFLAANKYNINTPSILTIGPDNVAPGFAISLASAAQLNSAAGTYVGTGWQPPLFFEGNFSYDVRSIEIGTVSTMWTDALEYIATQGAAKPGLIGMEVDISENDGPGLGGGPGSPLPNCTCWLYRPPPPLNLGVNQIKAQGGINFRGSPIWVATCEWPAGAAVIDPFDSLRYECINTANMGQPPHSTVGTKYTLAPYTGPSSAGTPKDPGTYDYYNFHTYAVLIIPAVSPNGPNASDAVGWVICFYDGLMTADLLPIGLNEAGQFQDQHQGLVQAGAYHFPLFFGCDNNIPLNIDWARVTTN